MKAETIREMIAECEYDPERPRHLVEVLELLLPIVEDLANVPALSREHPIEIISRFAKRAREALS